MSEKNESSVDPEDARRKRIKEIRLRWEEWIFQIASQTAEMLKRAGQEPDTPCQPTATSKSAAKHNPGFIWIINQAKIETGVVTPEGSQEPDKILYRGRGLTAQGKICEWNSPQFVTEEGQGEVTFLGFTSRYDLVKSDQVATEQYVDKQTPDEDVGLIGGMVRLLGRYGIEGPG